MKKLLSIGIICVTISACSFGPIKITHEEGHLPKIHVDLGIEECKVRAKRKEAKLDCKWKI